MKRIVSALDELRKINLAYDISIESIEQLKQEATHAKVCTPIIGKFSSGKSALINTLLGYNRRILKEDITPETAIPTEIVYSETGDVITIFQNDGVSTSISIEEYRVYQADANTVRCARLQLRNSFLGEIPDVMLVDMPGFESGDEIHNKAIDNYLPQSLAYIIAFPADDLVVRDSVGFILKELCLHDIPLCVVITKYDKRFDDFDVTFSKMKESLKRFVGDREVRYCITSSFTGDAEELIKFLWEIQAESQDILAHSFVSRVITIADSTENYLNTTLNSMQLSKSELDEKEEKLNKQFSNLESRFSTEQQTFNSEIADCAKEIKFDVQCALQAEENNLVMMAMNNQSINEHLNSVVRNAATVSAKKRLIPKVEKYLRRVSNCINTESVGDVHVSCYFDPEKINKGISSSAVAVAAGILIGLPILGVIAGIFLKLQGDKKREEAKQRIRMKLQNEVFPQVLREIENGIMMTITEQVKLVNTSIESEIKTQKEVLKKAMDDVRGQIADEQDKKDKMAADINKDLERIGEIKDGLR